MPKLLIIEENNEMRRSLIGFLRRQSLDIDIFEAINGDDGMMKVTTVKPDVVIIDNDLSQITCMGSVNQIKKLLPRCEIIVLTVFEKEVCRKIFRKAEISEFVNKHVMYDELVSVLMRCVDHKAAVRG